MKSPFESNPSQHRGLIDSNDRLAQQLLKALWSREDNILLSPLSLTTALGMVYVGSMGQMKQEFERTLYFNDDQAQRNKAYDQHLSQVTDGTFRSVNSVWLKDTFDVFSKYRETIAQDFKALIGTLDFNKPDLAAKRINAWVASATNDRIKELVRPDMFNDASRMVLANAALFKDKWETEFNPTSTHRGVFYTPTGAVPSMQMVQERTLNYYQDGSHEYVELPYKGRFAMGIMLPRSDERPPWSLSRSRSEMSPDQVILHLPRMKVECSYELSERLDKMGLSTLFWHGEPMTKSKDQEPVTASFVGHKTFLDVGEEGTEAAAATGIGMCSGSLWIPPRTHARVINVNRPFVMTIIERDTGMLAFVGRINRPI